MPRTQIHDIRSTEQDHDLDELVGYIRHRGQDLRSCVLHVNKMLVERVTASPGFADCRHAHLKDCSMYFSVRRDVYFA